MNNKIKFISCAIAFSLFIPQCTYVNAAETDIYSVNKADSSRLQDDFYNSVNKDWLKTAVIKDGYCCNSAEIELNDKITQQEKDLINYLISNKNNYSKNSEETKIINFYQNYINIDERNKEGVKPIQGMLEKIKNIKSVNDINDLYKYNILNMFIPFECQIDDKDSTKYALYITTSTLSLEDSDEYTKPSENTQKKKEIMADYYTKILTLAGYSEEEAKEKVDNLFKFENMIAPSIMGMSEASDDNNIDQQYNVVTLDELDNIAPNLKIKDYLEKMKADKADKIILTQPKWLKTLNSIYTDENLQMFKDYLEIRKIARFSQYLSYDFKRANIDCENKLYGSKGGISLEDQALNGVNTFLQMPLGKAYVNKYFDQKTKTDIENMADNLKNNYKKRIEKLDWMSEETKKEAIKKLDNLRINVGYPDKWDDCSNLDIKSSDEGGSLVDNIINLDKYSKQESINKLNTTVDKDAFGCPPQIADASYNPLCNSITIPAGILQKPFYDKNASKEQNYGGIGTIIGHEMSHAFDNNGAQFDSDGNFKNWWVQKDYDKFKEKTQKVRDYFSTVKTDSGKNVNGDLTVGENIADIGGVRCALDIIDQMDNPDYKGFFESYATIRRMIATPEELDNEIKNDEHSPKKVRVNSVLPQFDEFYKTYGITENDKMYIRPEDRIQIW